MDNSVIEKTCHWLEKAVIGLNLCPFAKSVYVKNRIRFSVTDAVDSDTLLYALIDELVLLADHEPEQIDTTLLIHPYTLTNFTQYNDFLAVADMTVKQMGFEGIFQIASFHPDYQFDGTSTTDITNYTNRSPYPMLHLLREESVEIAVRAIPDAGDIVERNQETLRRLRMEGWRSLMRQR